MAYSVSAAAWSAVPLLQPVGDGHHSQPDGGDQAAMALPHGAQLLKHGGGVGGVLHGGQKGKTGRSPMPWRCSGQQSGTAPELDSHFSFREKGRLAGAGGGPARRQPPFSVRPG